MIPSTTRAALEQLARLNPGDLTAVGHVLIGTETARAILQALDNAQTLQAVRALLDGRHMNTVMLRALLATGGEETIDVRAREETIGVHGKPESP